MDVEVINEWIDTLKNNFTDSIFTILFALVIFLIGFLVARKVKVYMHKFLVKLNIEQPILGYTSYSIYIGCLIIDAMIALSVIGVPQTTLVSTIGVIGVSLGLAFKEALSNIGSGYLLLFLKPFKINDYIEFDNISGTVSSIHIFNTTLKTFDNKTIIVPNSKLTNQNIVNYTKQEKRRVDIELKFPYGTDMSNIVIIIENILKSEERILENPEPLVAIRNFKDNGMELVVRGWVKTDDYWDVYYLLVKNIEKEIRNNNIDMNIPQKIIK